MRAIGESCATSNKELTVMMVTVMMVTVMVVTVTVTDMMGTG